MDPLDVLQLSRVSPSARAVGIWLNILCLLVERGFTFYMFRLPSSLLKMTFSGHVFTAELFLLGHCPAEDHI